MTIHTIITLVDILLWLVMAANVLYILFFALTALLPTRTSHSSLSTSHASPNFLILFPAYHEDAVIVNSVRTFLHQDYSKELYEVVVISDHMSPATNALLSKLPITLLQPSFEKSSKAKALQFAMAQTKKDYDYVVILDADNVVAHDFLSKLAQMANPREVIQCHRTAKNADNDIAVLDGISEEINNSIFRRGHNRIGLSSALIGSGMCFDYEWFKENVKHLDSAVEDRELEALLLKQGIFIRYADDIYVMDEKVSNSENFQRQRLRWMTGQVQALFRMLPYIPRAIVSGNINYIDKTLQQALIPRSILLVLIPLFTLVFTLIEQFSILNWLLLLIALLLALFLAIPSRLRTKAIFSKAMSLPQLVWRMLTNILHIRPKNKDFIHTTHSK